MKRRMLMYNNEENKQPWTYEVEPSYQPQQPQYDPKPQPPKKEKKPLTGGKIIALALCCSLVGGVLGAIGGTLAGGHSIADSDVKYGLSVTGTVHPDRIYPNNHRRIA